MLYTIGFTKKSAEDFFTRLRKAGVKRLLDVRLNNTSQLASFAKRDDLIFFLRELAGIKYQHLPVLAPTQAMLDGYKKQKGAWETYVIEYTALLLERHPENDITQDLLDGGCFLCSEDEPDQCHRRLAADYFKNLWPALQVIHL